jgi:hypothetical protein
MTALQAAQDEIARLRELLDATSQGVTEARYIEQARKLRDLNVRYEGEKARCLKLQQQLVQVERAKAEEADLSKKGVLLPSERANAAAGPSAAEMELQMQASQLQDARARLEKATATSASLRAQCERADREFARLKRVLLNELGDPAAVEKILKDGEAAAGAQGGDGGWRGRAQQIALLKKKVTDLTKELDALRAAVENGDFAPVEEDDVDGSTGVGGGAAPSIVSRARTTATATTYAGAAGRDYDDTHRDQLAVRERRRANDLGDAKKAVESAEADATKERRRADAMAARVTTLERETQQLRGAVQRLMDKTANDDELIAAYKQELDESQRGVRDQLRQVGASYASGAAVTQLESNAAALRQQIAAQNDDILRLRSELAAARRTSTGGAPGLPALPTGGISTAVASSPAASTALNAAEWEALARDQRRHIEALEMKLAQVERKALAALNREPVPEGSENVLRALREENTSLRERVAAMTQMMTREVELIRANVHAAPSALPTPRGSISTNANANAGAAAIGGASGSREAELQADLDALRAQYDGLRRELNRRAAAELQQQHRK